MKVKVKLVSCVSLFATPCTIAYQVPPSMEFSRQEYWSGMPFPSPRYLLEPGIKSGCPTLQAKALLSEPPERQKNIPGQNIGVGSCSLLQGIFPTQGSNPGLSHCRQTLYCLSHQGSLKNS